MISRRGFLGGILAAACAPAIVKAESIMRIAQPSSGSVGATYSYEFWAIGEAGLIVDSCPEALFKGEVGRVDGLRFISDGLEPLRVGGVPVQVDDRWLFIDQLQTKRNGIYVVEQSHYPDLLAREPGPAKMKQSPGRRSNMKKFYL